MIIWFNTDDVLTYLVLTYPYEPLYFILYQLFNLPTISTFVPLANSPNFLELFNGLLLTSDLSMTDPNTNFILTSRALTYPYEPLYFILYQPFDFPTISTFVPLPKSPNFLDIIDDLLLTFDLDIVVPNAITGNSSFLGSVFAFSSSEKSP